MATNHNASPHPRTGRRRPRTGTPATIGHLDGKHAIITGANRGLGHQVALQLALAGAAVTLACRDGDLGDIARRRILEQAPYADVSVGHLNLASLAGVRAFAEKIAANVPVVDILVNNAAVMALPHENTSDGFERQLGVNHLGHFALTGLLLPQLLARPGGRVVTVTSIAHKHGRIRHGDLHGRFRYSPLGAYCQSKLANAMFAVEFHRRLARAAARSLATVSPPPGLGSVGVAQRPISLVSVAAHPGYAATDLTLTGPQAARQPLREHMFRAARAVIAQPAAAGALPLLYAATGEVEPGALYGPSRLGQTRGRPAQVGFSGRALDAAAGRRLWELSERLTGVSYDLID